MIKSYKYQDTTDQPNRWSFANSQLGKINLIIGASASGKSRWMNSLFNFAHFIISGKPFRSGIFEIKIESKGILYKWNFNSENKGSGKPLIKENITMQFQNKEEVIIDRSENKFIFKGDKLPKLERGTPSVTLLKDEEVIKPLYNNFMGIIRRFHENALLNATSISLTNPALPEMKIDSESGTLLGLGLNLSQNLFVLNKKFPEKFKTIEGIFVKIFPFVKKLEIGPFPKHYINIIPKNTQTIFVKEQGIANKIPIQELSSGMQKVLLIISDVFVLPEGGLYFIDEYENSLGVNAIDFLPDFLDEYGGNKQFFITTHHPYLINNISMKNWLVFNRQGSKVEIRQGQELEDKYGKSKQEAFIKLINDPFYTGSN